MEQTSQGIEVNAWHGMFILGVEEMGEAYKLGSRGVPRKEIRLMTVVHHLLYVEVNDLQTLAPSEST